MQPEFIDVGHPWKRKLGPHRFEHQIRTVLTAVLPHHGLHGPTTVQHDGTLNHAEEGKIFTCFLERRGELGSERLLK